MKLGNKSGSRSKGEYNVDSHSLGFVIGIPCYYKKMKFKKTQDFPLLKSMKLKEQLLVKVNFT